MKSSSRSFFLYVIKLLSSFPSFISTLLMGWDQSARNPNLTDPLPVPCDARARSLALRVCQCCTTPTITSLADGLFLFIIWLNKLHFLKCRTRQSCPYDVYRTSSLDMLDIQTYMSHFVTSYSLQLQVTQSLSISGSTPMLWRAPRLLLMPPIEDFALITYSNPATQ